MSTRKYQFRLQLAVMASIWRRAVIFFFSDGKEVEIFRGTIGYSFFLDRLIFGFFVERNVFRKDSLGTL